MSRPNMLDIIVISMIVNGFLYTCYLYSKIIIKTKTNFYTVENYNLKFMKLQQTHLSCHLFVCAVTM